MCIDGFHSDCCDRNKLRTLIQRDDSGVNSAECRLQPAAFKDLEVPPRKKHGGDVGTRQRCLQAAGVTWISAVDVVCFCLYGRKARSGEWRDGWIKLIRLICRGETVQTLDVFTAHTACGSAYIKLFFPIQAVVSTAARLCLDVSLYCCKAKSWFIINLFARMLHSLMYNPHPPPPPPPSASNS